MAKTYIDGLFPEAEYLQQKKLLEMQLKSLVIAEVNAAREAGELIANLPGLWQQANLTERKKSSSRCWMRFILRPRRSNPLSP